MKKLIAGNWKMNLDVASAQDLARGLKGAAHPAADVLVCPAFVHVPGVLDVLKGADIWVGAQDCSDQDDGAYTGQVSAAMLADVGCSHVILGHSERREYIEESDALVAAKAEKAHAAGLVAIICVGEKEEERDAGQEQDVVAAQLSGSLPSSATAENTVIAYEPVWAIGTGKTASAADVADMHRFIREQLKEKLDNADNMRILYGGSMKPANAAELLDTSNVDGGLIGGASLKIDDFLEIVRASKI